MMFNPISSARHRHFDAKTQAEWAAKANERDTLSGAKAWREAQESDLYAWKSIKRRLEKLRGFRTAGDNQGLLFNLNEGIHGNMDGIGSERLYARAAFGTKNLIEDYIAEIASALDHLASPVVDDISLEEKRDFFDRAQQCYGQSALMLSGSGSFLFFHMGVVKAMLEQGVLPDIISGSSGGSIVGAVLCTHKDEEIAPYFDPVWLDSKVAELGLELEVGQRTSRDDVRAQIDALIPDLTFQESFELTGRHLNISVAPAARHQNSRLMNAIASPNVLIREAVQASCAVPGVFDPVMLMARDNDGKRVPYLPDRRWVDGSVTNDLPAKRLGRLYGVNHYIVSQANPLATPFVSELKQPDSALASVRQASIATLKTWVNANMIIWEKPLALFPMLNAAANMAKSVIDQDYGGDITIMNPPRLLSLRKVLSRLSVSEMQDLILTGERATWPRIEMIRNQTLISKTLTRIRAHLG